VDAREVVALLPPAVDAVTRVINLKTEAVHWHRKSLANAPATLVLRGRRWTSSKRYKCQGLELSIILKGYVRAKVLKTA
jgi:hypothetical protein